MRSSHRNLTHLVFAVLLFSLTTICLLQVVASADEPTNREKSQVRRIHALILKAGRLFKAENFEASLESISDAQERLEKLANGADQELIELLKPEYERLVNAHQLLTAEGQKPPELKPLPAPVSDDQKMVSFKEEVAPFLVARCGRCHVNRTSGNFSAASYNALGQSTMVAVGMPDDSRIVQVILDEEMPPGGSIEETDLQMLKNWISQGAKFDGDDPTENLRQLAPAPNRNRAPVNIATPTGKETVSFGLHVAPILIQNCAPCHIDSNNPRGNLNMGTFGRFIRGGDSGSPFSAGSSMDSLIMQRLTAANGSNVMPPTGKLDDQTIEIVRRWIDEGAAFDGGEPGLDTRNVAAIRKADSQSHDELKVDRLAKAEANWNLAMPDIVPDSFHSENFYVFGTNGIDELEAVSEIAEKLIPKIRSSLKLQDNGVFLKGNSSIFVFQRQYDFSEFGTMIVRHPLPKEMNGYWGYSTIDAFSSLLIKRGKQPEDVQVSLAQQLAAIKIASLSPDVPRWFADGVGFWVAARTFPRDDEVKDWDSQAAAVIAEMQQPDDFLDGKLVEHQAALVAYVFVKQLRLDSSRFTKLFKLLRQETPFDQAFNFAYGATPKEMFGSNSNRNRNDRRRKR